MAILTQNAKMKKSSQNGIDIYNFGIPAYMSTTGLKTCPNASNCVNGCYARTGTYRFKNTINAYETRLQLTQSEIFVPRLINEIEGRYLNSLSKGNKCLIRIHDSGDFYSMAYAMAWIDIINRSPKVQFYAYTKMVSMFQLIEASNLMPNNLAIIYSYGGREDSHIDTTKHRHAKVFQTETELLKAGYSDASDNDLVAALGPNNKIGLIYHGVKSYKNTTWNKVK